MLLNLPFFWVRVELCVALGEYLKTGVPLPSICAAPVSVLIFLSSTSSAAKEFIRKDGRKELLYYVNLIRAC